MFLETSVAMCGESEDVYFDSEGGRPLTTSGPEGKYLSLDGKVHASIVGGIPRFVKGNSYADSFGLQWHEYSRTQLDSFNGLSLSAERLERCLGFSLAELSGKRVLEAGCGAGRFTEVLLAYGAEVHAFDLTNAIEVNLRNNGAKYAGRMHLAQADIARIPFKKESYDLVVCLGVL
jgi:SAM-dependent methyltransferase